MDTFVGKIMFTVKKYYETWPKLICIVLSCPNLVQDKIEL
jgi:hypothetical protein